jgi:hypothetical protein
VGDGPHVLALVLRLLEPDADLLSDKERHVMADLQKSWCRPYADVRRHSENLMKGPSAVYKKNKKNKKKKTKHKSSTTTGAEGGATLSPPPLALECVREHVLVVDDNNGGDDYGLMRVDGQLETKL